MESLISKKDKIFIAGAAGMVGSAIYRKLKEFGYENNSMGGNILQPKRKELDLLDSEKVKKWFQINKPDIVIIAAAKVGGIFANNNQPADFILENLTIQNNLIKNSYEYGVKRLLFLGSSCIYPKLCKQPIREDYLLTSELESTNQWYAIAKIAGIKLCEALREQYNFDAISLMPTNLYGPGDNYHPMNSHVLPALISRFYEAKINGLDSVVCWGTGNALREFMFVDDLADACIFLLEHWNPSDFQSPKYDDGRKLSFLNVGTGKDISIKELAKLIANKIGFNGEIFWDKTKPDGTPKKQLSVERINSLGWKAKVSLEEGLDRTIKNFIEIYKKA